MDKSEFLWENEMHKILLDFEMQSDPLILAIKPDPLLINKKEIIV